MEDEADLVQKLQSYLLSMDEKNYSDISKKISQSIFCTKERASQLIDNMVTVINVRPHKAKLFALLLKDLEERINYEVFTRYISTTLWDLFQNLENNGESYFLKPARMCLLYFCIKTEVIKQQSVFPQYRIFTNNRSTKYLIGDMFPLIAEFIYQKNPKEFDELLAQCRRNSNFYGPKNMLNIFDKINEYSFKKVEECFLYGDFESSLKSIIIRDDVTSFIENNYEDTLIISNIFDPILTNFPHKNEFTPLEFALIVGASKIVNHLRIKNQSLITPNILPMAIAGQNFDIVRHFKDQFDSNCLEIAIAFHQHDISDWIKSMLKDVDYQAINKITIRSNNIAEAIKAGKFLVPYLPAAAQVGHPDMLRQLTSFEDAVIGPSAIVAAASSASTECLDMLITKKPGLINVEWERETPLQAAIKAHCYQSVKLLLDKGADPNLPAENPPLEVAYFCGFFEAFELLTKHPKIDTELVSHVNFMGRYKDKFVKIGGVIRFKRNSYLKGYDTIIHQQRLLDGVPETPTNYSYSHYNQQHQYLSSNFVQNQSYQPNYNYTYYNYAYYDSSSDETEEEDYYDGCFEVTRPPPAVSEMGNRVTVSEEEDGAIKGFVEGDTATDKCEGDDNFDAERAILLPLALEKEDSPTKLEDA